MSGKQSKRCREFVDGRAAVENWRSTMSPEAYARKRTALYKLTKRMWVREHKRPA